MSRNQVFVKTKIIYSHVAKFYYNAQTYYQMTCVIGKSNELGPRAFKKIYISTNASISKNTPKKYGH